ncbi:MAG: hypothetical protein ACJAT5_000962 [Lentimonas sp.]
MYNFFHQIDMQIFVQDNLPKYLRIGPVNKTEPSTRKTHPTIAFTCTAPGVVQVGQPATSG